MSPFKRALILATAAMTGIGGAWVIAQVTPQEAELVPHVVVVDTRVPDLLDSNHCWTGKAPAGVFPHHAIVTLPGKAPALVPSRVGFAIWQHDRAGTLHGFCS